MPNVSEKKLKLLYLARLLWERTDGQHAVTLSQMMEELEAKGISAERKSLYDDLETLRRFGFDIRTRKGRTFEYYLAERPFSEKDLRCLVDAVRSDSELSKRRSGELVKKLVGLGSQYQGEELLRVLVSKDLEANPAGEKLTLEFSQELLSQVEKRFGKLSNVESLRGGRMRVQVIGAVDSSLFSWLFEMGLDMRLTSPKKVAEQFRERAKSLAKAYKS